MFKLSCFPATFDGPCRMGRSDPCEINNIAPCCDGGERVRVDDDGSEANRLKWWLRILVLSSHLKIFVYLLAAYLCRFHCSPFWRKPAVIVLTSAHYSGTAVNGTTCLWRIQYIFSRTHEKGWIHDEVKKTTFTTNVYWMCSMVMMTWQQSCNLVLVLIVQKRWGFVIDVYLPLSHFSTWNVICMGFEVDYLGNDVK